jgi:hypothetical protein
MRIKKNNGEDKKEKGRSKSIKEKIKKRNCIKFSNAEDIKDKSKENQQWRR